MMKALSKALVLILLTSVTLWEGGHAGGGVGADAKAGWPAGGWSFNAQPYTGPGYDARPAMVSSVGTRLESLTVEKVRVENFSVKAVAAVRLGWTLTNSQDPQTVLQSGESPLLHVRERIEAGKSHVLKQPVVSFAKIHKPLVRQGNLEGNFRLTLAVVEVLYEDDTTWSVTGAQGANFIKAASRKSTASQGECPDVICQSLGGQMYYCGGPADDLYCTVCPTFCCTSVCTYGSTCDCGPEN